MDNQVKTLNPWSVAAIALCVGTLGTIFQGCSQPPTPKTTETTEKLDITVSILPQKYFVERIGGENVNVNVMVEPERVPRLTNPSPNSCDRSRKLKRI
jgi:ABC-type Zn uptake system ZnuABC Zn-binding protein ZnuA